MEGGITAWNGLIAEGIPDAGVNYFAPAGSPEELVALAWIMEDGSRRFYAEVADILKDDSAINLFQQLTKAEEHHKASLFKVYSEFTGKAEAPNFPRSVFSEPVDTNIMEGGMRVNEALQWAKKKDLSDILELSMAIETNSYDLYILMEKKMDDENSKKVFDLLSFEEKQHLDRLSKEFEERLE